ncbi:MAG: hypothetical protein L3J53_04425 [Proteobacteria bacterium]|nr:hypothetical protein [Pseudomonadota bacterium]
MTRIQLHTKFDEILLEIEDIIAKIGSYPLSDSQRVELIKLFKKKIQEAKGLKLVV